MVRGYITGSGWKSYRQAGTVCGIRLPEKLVESDRLPTPIFTPSTKEEMGKHDINIDFDEMVKRIVSFQAPYKPLFYNMQDEGGLARQNQANEFCYGPHCMKKFRTWIRTQYDSLAALTVALILPLAALSTFFLMRQFGMSANLMSLGGLAIAIGLLVDAAVVVVENVERHVRMGKGRLAAAAEAAPRRAARATPARI